MSTPPLVQSPSVPEQTILPGQNRRGVPPEYYLTEICVHFLKGNCRFVSSEECGYLHSTAPASSSSSLSSQPHQNQPKAKYLCQSQKRTQGDWNCVQCAFSNFSRRHSCGRCGVTKPSQPASNQSSPDGSEQSVDDGSGGDDQIKNKSEGVRDKGASNKVTTTSTPTPTTQQKTNPSASTATNSAASKTGGSSNAHASAETTKAQSNGTNNTKKRQANHHNNNNISNNNHNKNNRHQKNNAKEGSKNFTSTTTTQSVSVPPIQHESVFTSAAFYPSTLQHGQSGGAKGLNGKGSHHHNNHHTNHKKHRHHQPLSSANAITATTVSSAGAVVGGAPIPTASPEQVQDQQQAPNGTNLSDQQPHHPIGRHSNCMGWFPSHYPIPASNSVFSPHPHHPHHQGSLADYSTILTPPPHSHTMLPGDVAMMLPSSSGASAGSLADQQQSTSIFDPESTASSSSSPQQQAQQQQYNHVTIENTTHDGLVSMYNSLLDGYYRVNIINRDLNNELARIHNHFNLPPPPHHHQHHPHHPQSQPQSQQQQSGNPYHHFNPHHSPGLYMPPPGPHHPHHHHVQQQQSSQQQHDTPQLQPQSSSASIQQLLSSTPSISTPVARSNTDSTAAVAVAPLLGASLLETNLVDVTVLSSSSSSSRLDAVAASPQQQSSTLQSTTTITDSVRSNQQQLQQQASNQNDVVVVSPLAMTMPLTTADLHTPLTAADLPTPHLHGIANHISSPLLDSRPLSVLLGSLNPADGNALDAPTAPGSKQEGIWPPYFG